MGTVNWAYLKDMAAYITNPSIPMYGMWDSKTPGLHSNGAVTPGEGGVDLTAPPGTPVYALADGQVVGAGYWKDIGHGVVTTRVNVPGHGQQDLYYQHIVLDPSIAHCTGGSCSQQIKRGQKIGVVGQFGETEMGFNAQWGSIWGTNHPGAWVFDPRPMLAALMQGSSTTLQGSTPNPSNPDGSSPSSSNSGPNLQGFAVKAGVFVVALVLLGFGAFLTFKPQAEAAMSKVKGLAVKTAEVAA